MTDEKQEEPTVLNGQIPLLSFTAHQGTPEEKECGALYAKEGLHAPKII